MNVPWEHERGAALLLCDRSFFYPSLFVGRRA